MAGELPIQKLLNKLGLAEQAIGVMKQRGRDGAKAGDQVGTAPAQTPPATAGLAERPGPVDAKSEEYYLRNCPIELASVAVKLLVDVLIQVGWCHSLEDVPAQVGQLLLECNRKSDQAVEQEILEKFLADTKRIIDTQIRELLA